MGTHFIVPVADVPTGPQAVIDRAQTVTVAIDADQVLFALLLPLNATLKTDLATLRTKQTAATAANKGPNAVPERDTAKDKVREDIAEICHELKKVVHAKPPEEGDGIIYKAGFRPAAPRTPNQTAFAVRYGGSVGSARARIKSPAPRKRFTIQWGASPDNGKTWLFDDAGSKVTCMFTGLTVGATYVFRFRVKIGDTTSDWTVSAPYLVK